MTTPIQIVSVARILTHNLFAMSLLAYSRDQCSGFGQLSPNSLVSTALFKCQMAICDPLFPPFPRKRLVFETLEY